MVIQRFFESIRMEEGIYSNLTGHQNRINLTFKTYFPFIKPLDLKAILPQIKAEGLFKVRVSYDDRSFETSYDTYKKRNIEKIEVIETHCDFNYTFKSENRQLFQQLLHKSSADEIMISKDGFMTDSSYSNLAFWDGMRWYTPKTYLLNGVRRQQLIYQNKIKPISIHKDDLKRFQKVSLINAMLDLGDLEVPIPKMDKTLG